MDRHMSPHFHWCAACWDWVCLCVHFAEPLGIPRRRVQDLQIRSIGYDRRRGRLEVEFTTVDDVRQFYPVSPVAFRELLRAKPMYLAFHRLVIKPRWIRFQQVRTEAGIVLMMAREAQKLIAA